MKLKKDYAQPADIWELYSQLQATLPILKAVKYGRAFYTEYEVKPLTLRELKLLRKFKSNV